MTSMREEFEEAKANMFRAAAEQLPAGLKPATFGPTCSALDEGYECTKAPHSDPQHAAHSSLGRVVHKWA